MRLFLNFINQNSFYILVYVVLDWSSYSITAIVKIYDSIDIPLLVYHVNINLFETRIVTTWYVFIDYFSL